jgi:hypothetical protein
MLHKVFTIKDKVIRMMAVARKPLFQQIPTTSTLKHYQKHGEMLKTKQTWKYIAEIQNMNYIFKFPTLT